MTPLDRLGRPLRNLRLSVTDRCNLRCQYCMPEEEYVWLPREDLLHFEEMSRLVDAFTGCGVDKVRLTGGEPLLRRDLPTLVSLLSAKPALRDLAMTTNGILLAGHAGALRRAGLHRVTVSLDTLRPDRFKALTRQDALDSVLSGIRAARETFGSLKLDTVVIRGVNDDEIVSLLEFARAEGAELRYIEYMDVGGATHWSMDKVVSRPEILDRIARARGLVEPVAEETSAPADRFRLADGTTFGIISSTTDPFCRSCDRSRVTADGMWYLCLYASAGIDLRRPLRDGRSLADIAALVESVWQGRTDRGAETRLTVRDRRPFVPVSALRANPHLEMHTRGG
ncbi:MAG: GTP 3',8-cyclase MoaA [Acidobacteria bacterium]|nr:GTP 3',8-cyclase MoaA [Acidobacteriota bacterium]MBI3264790.1 GTP 3',8-cyclase MoaA [Acidobacteriota bacterium]